MEILVTMASRGCSNCNGLTESTVEEATLACGGQEY